MDNNVFRVIDTNLYTHRLRNNTEPSDYPKCGCRQRFPSGNICDSETCRNVLEMVECLSSHCDKTRCQNMKFTSKYQANLVISEAGGKGRGLVAQERIAKDMFLSEYTGEVISEMEYERRMKLYSDANTHFYIMGLGAGEYLDAGRYGNQMRFMNHSCSPNSHANVYRVGGEYQVGVKSLRDIAKDEEITIDYGWDRALRPTICLCGSRFCRYIICSSSIPPYSESCLPFGQWRLPNSSDISRKGPYDLVGKWIKVFWMGDKGVVSSDIEYSDDEDEDNLTEFKRTIGSKSGLNYKDYRNTRIQRVMQSDAEGLGYWYTARVMGYDPSTKEHQIQYCVDHLTSDEPEVSFECLMPQIDAINFFEASDSEYKTKHCRSGIYRVNDQFRHSEDSDEEDSKESPYWCILDPCVSRVAFESLQRKAELSERIFSPIQILTSSTDIQKTTPSLPSVDVSAAFLRSVSLFFPEDRQVLSKPVIPFSETDSFVGKHRARLANMRAVDGILSDLQRGDRPIDWAEAAEEVKLKVLPAGSLVSSASINNNVVVSEEEEKRLEQALQRDKSAQEALQKQQERQRLELLKQKKAMDDSAKKQEAVNMTQEYKRLLEQRAHAEEQRRRSLLTSGASQSTDTGNENTKLKGKSRQKIAGSKRTRSDDNRSRRKLLTTSGINDDPSKDKDKVKRARSKGLSNYKNRSRRRNAEINPLSFPLNGLTPSFPFTGGAYLSGDSMIPSVCDEMALKWREKLSSALPAAFLESLSLISDYKRSNDILLAGAVLHAAKSRLFPSLNHHSLADWSSDPQFVSLCMIAIYLYPSVRCVERAIDVACASIGYGSSSVPLELVHFTFFGFFQRCVASSYRAQYPTPHSLAVEALEQLLPLFPEAPRGILARARALQFLQQFSPLLDENDLNRMKNQQVEDDEGISLIPTSKCYETFCLAIAVGSGPSIGSAAAPISFSFATALLFLAMSTKNPTKSRRTLEIERRTPSANTSSETANRHLRVVVESTRHTIQLWKHDYKVRVRPTTSNDEISVERLTSSSYLESGAFAATAREMRLTSAFLEDVKNQLMNLKKILKFSQPLESQSENSSDSTDFITNDVLDYALAWCGFPTYSSSLQKSSGNMKSSSKSDKFCAPALSTQYDVTPMDIATADTRQFRVFPMLLNSVHSNSSSFEVPSISEFVRLFLCAKKPSSTDNNTVSMGEPMLLVRLRSLGPLLATIRLHAPTNDSRALKLFEKKKLAKTGADSRLVVSSKSSYDLNELYANLDDSLARSVEKEEKNDYGMFTTRRYLSVLSLGESSHFSEFYTRRALLGVIDTRALLPSNSSSSTDLESSLKDGELSTIVENVKNLDFSLPRNLNFSLPLHLLRDSSHSEDLYAVVDTNPHSLQSLLHSGALSAMKISVRLSMISQLFKCLIRAHDRLVSLPALCAASISISSLDSSSNLDMNGEKEKEKDSNEVNLSVCGFLSCAVPDNLLDRERRCKIFAQKEVRASLVALAKADIEYNWKVNDTMEEMVKLAAIYAPPEILLGIGSFASSVQWTFMVLLASILTGKAPFVPIIDGLSLEESILVAVESQLGSVEMNFPLSTTGRFYESYSQKVQKLREQRKLPPPANYAVFSAIEKVDAFGRVFGFNNLFDTLKEHINVSDEIIASFVSSSLHLQPVSRISPRDASSHDFIKALLSITSKSPSDVDNGCSSTVVIDNMLSILQKLGVNVDNLDSSASIDTKNFLELLPSERFLVIDRSDDALGMSSNTEYTTFSSTSLDAHMELDYGDS